MKVNVVVSTMHKKVEADISSCSIEAYYIVLR